MLLSSNISICLAIRVAPQAYIIVAILLSVRILKSLRADEFQSHLNNTTPLSSRPTSGVASLA